MQEHKDNNEVTPPAEDTTNESKSNVWTQKIATFMIVAALLGLLVCAGLLIQTYITHKPAFKIPGYYSLVSSVAGFLILIIGLNIAILADIKQKTHDYVSAFISSVVEALKYLIW